MKNKKKYDIKKTRNWIAVRAFSRGGAGSHGDKKKQKNKSLCRGKIRV